MPLDPARLQIAADLLVDHGFDDVAQELQSRPMSMALAKAISTDCAFTIRGRVVADGVVEELTARALVPRTWVLSAPPSGVLDELTVTHLAQVATDLAVAVIEHFRKGWLREEAPELANWREAVENVYCEVVSRWEGEMVQRLRALNRVRRNLTPPTVPRP